MYSRRTKTKVWILWFFLEWGKIPMGGDTKSKDRIYDHPETAPPADPSHIQTTNPDTIVDGQEVLSDRILI